MNVIHIAKSPKADFAIINITGNVPEFTRDKDKADWHKEQGKLIAGTLLESLPANTVNQVLMQLVERLTE